MMIEPKQATGSKFFNRAMWVTAAGLVAIPIGGVVVKPDLGRQAGRWLAGKEDPVINLKRIAASINKGVDSVFEELRTNCKNHHGEIETLLNVKLPTDIADHKDRFCKKGSLEEFDSVGNIDGGVDELLDNTEEAREYKAQPNVKAASREMLNFSSIVTLIASINELSDRQIESLKIDTQDRLAKNAPPQYAKDDLRKEIKDILDTAKNNNELKKRLINILKIEGIVIEFDDVNFSKRLEIPANKARFLSEMLGLLNFQNPGENQPIPRGASY